MRGTLRVGGRMGGNTHSARCAALSRAPYTKGGLRNTMGSRYKRKHGEVKRYVVLADGSKWTLDPKSGGMPLGD